MLNVNVIAIIFKAYLHKCLLLNMYTQLLQGFLLLKEKGVLFFCIKINVQTQQTYNRVKCIFFNNTLTSQIFGLHCLLQFSFFLNWKKEMEKKGNILDYNLQRTA